MWFRTIWALLRKDAMLELRRRETLVSMAAFGLMSFLLYHFTLPLEGERIQALAPGLLWISVLFTAMLGLGKAFAVERQNDVLDMLAASPAPRPAIFLGKLAANLVFVGLIEALLLPLFSVFFPAGGRVPWMAVAGVLALATLGLVTLGTLFSAMTVSLRAREVVFPLLLLPLMVPIIIATSQALAAFIGVGEPTAAPWLRMLGVADIVFLVASLWAFEFLIED